MFKTYGFFAWNDILGLLDAESGKQVFSNTHKLIKNRNQLLLTKAQSKVFKSIFITGKTNKIVTPKGVLYLSEVRQVGEKATNVIYVDKDELEFPLELRTKQEGDVFFPLGMKGKKKLSKYFKDEKFSLIDKEKALLLCSGKAIIWLLNKRADNRFKVTDKTKKILKIALVK